MLILTERTDGKTRVLRLEGAHDGEGVTLIDGARIGAIADLHRRLAAAGRKLGLTGAQGQPRDCLDDLGLARMLAA